VRDDYPQSALMESSDYHGNENSRSFIALHPIGHVAIAHGKARLVFPDGSGTVPYVASQVRARGIDARK
jgi:anthranilate synthase component 1